MSVLVRVKSGSHHHTDGKRYRPRAEITVSEDVYKAFAFKFERLGDSSEPAPVQTRALPENVTQEALDLIVAQDVDWAHIKGSGKGGKILLKDVRGYLNA